LTQHQTSIAPHLLILLFLHFLTLIFHFTRTIAPVPPAYCCTNQNTIAVDFNGSFDLESLAFNSFKPIIYFAAALFLSLSVHSPSGSVRTKTFLVCC